MSFAQSVRWWEEWQLRFLVLASLAFQYFLFAAALLRKRRIPHWFRALIWLAYQGGDIVAVYALATLFNRHKKDEVAAAGSDGGGGAHLDILWAPVLLLHLGGQDGITAYSIEDNENWRRHLLVAASQITVAIYVFCKSWWFHDGRLLRASILLFVPGVFKCLEKPWALWNATVASIANSSDPQMTLTFEEDDRTLPTDTDDMDSLDKYVTAARGCVDKEAKRETPLFFDDKMSNDEPYHLFVDLAHPYYIRLKNLQVMAAAKGTGRAEAHGRVRVAVSRAFDRLYTKHMASYGGVLRAVVVIVTLAVVGLFRRRGESLPYARADVVVTYVLLCFTAALELISAAVVLGSGLPETDDKLSQYNLLAYLSRNRRRRRLRHAALLVGLKDQLDWLWPTAPPVPSRRVTELVHEHVVGGWMGYKDNAGGGVWKGIRSVEDYRRFNDSRGQRTLESAGLVATAGGGVGGGTAVERILRMPFDESVVAWHLATELCYFDHVDVGGGSATRHGRAISEYMAYLLFVKPWMLMPGARRKLFRAAYVELRRMVEEEEESPSELEEEDDGEYEETERWKKAKPRAMDEIARKIIRKLRDPPTATSSGGARSPARSLSADLVRIAWELSYELLEFGKGKAEEFVNEEGKKKQLAEEEKKKASAAVAEPEKKQLTAEEKKRKEEEEKKQAARNKEALANRARKHGDERMWEVIQGVWVEMLCFSAGRCSGYLHAKSLGKGGEYLTYVWLLLSYMGMETMAERMQRTELRPVEGDAGALVSTSDLEEDDDDEPSARTGAATTAATAVVAAPPAAISGSAVVPFVGDDNV
ncbi:unnamed protein product [Urochloa decumbens]|uniref:DUF4220 domain-containing protein n=1 Tax=Urochloa decumbens TaxID=240449 RepID=A0ABC9ARC2_9POAL